jgi:hypothetical protein
MVGQPWVSLFGVGVREDGVLPLMIRPRVRDAKRYEEERLLVDQKPPARRPKARVSWTPCTKGTSQLGRFIIETGGSAFQGVSRWGGRGGALERSGVAVVRKIIAAFFPLQVM